MCTHTRIIIAFSRLKYVLTSVIVVDDDRGTLAVFNEFLEENGINILGEARNGKSAVELYKNCKPDVVLLDVLMPKYDGIYALEKIREFDPNAKVIMVTADLTADTEEKMTQLNASAVIYKPYEIDRVLETIDKVNKGVFVSFKSA